jgi:hypothetical protein
MLCDASKLSAEEKRTWDAFLAGTETHVIYFCDTSFNINRFSFDDVSSPGSISFELQTAPSTMGTLARFVSILDAQE